MTWGMFVHQERSANENVNVQALINELFIFSCSVSPHYEVELYVH